MDMDSSASRRIWAASPHTTLYEIPVTAHYIECVREIKEKNNREVDYGAVCECKNGNCDCRWHDGGGNACPCMLVWGSECKSCCVPCSRLTARGQLDNRQIRRTIGGLQTKKTKVIKINNELGWSVVVDEDFKNGELLGIFVGELKRKKMLR